ncbi:conserved Plasmodium protein, unknown function [Plasmodium vivax]|uniref:Uncharacterized protein n=1 Tax=Plasmodium vivax TaxID=5855 RepID=A0A565A295_PLAVI|nr:conserved Plasmodium protein, unknown function [Plasmodium vivax]
MEEAKEGTPLEDKCSGNEEPKKGKTTSRCKKVKGLHKAKSNEKRKKSSKNFKTFKTFRYFKPFRQFKNAKSLKSLKNGKNCKSQKKREKEKAKKRAKRKAKKNAPKELLLPVGQARRVELPNEGDATLGNVEKQLSPQMGVTQNRANSSNSGKKKRSNISSNVGNTALPEDKFVPNHSDEQMRGSVNNGYEIEGSVDEDHPFAVHTDVATEKTPPVEAHKGDNLNYVVEKNSPNRATQLGVTMQHCEKNSCREANWPVLEPHMSGPQRNCCVGAEEMAQMDASRTSKQNDPNVTLPYGMHPAQHEAEAAHHLIDPLGTKQTSRIQFREIIASMKEDTKSIISVMENLSEEKLLYLTIPFSENYDIVKYFNFLSLEKIKKMINLLHVDNYKNFILSFNQKKIIEIVNHVSVNTSISVLLNLSNNKVAYILSHIEEKILINLLNGIPICKFYHIAECLPMQKVSLLSINITYEKLYVLHNSLPSKKLHQLANNLSVETLNRLINELPLYKSVKVLKMLPPCKIAHSINVNELTPQFASEIGRSFNAPDIVEIVNYLNEGNAAMLLSRCNSTKIILYINYISMEEFKSLAPKLPTQFLAQIVNDISLKLLVELFVSLPEEKAAPCLCALTQRKLNFALRVNAAQRVVIDTVLRQGGAVQRGFPATEATIDATTKEAAMDVTTTEEAMHLTNTASTTAATNGAAPPHRRLLNMIDEHNWALLLSQLNADEYAPFCNLLSQDKVEQIANSLCVDCKTAAALILHLPLTKMVGILQSVGQKRREEIAKYMPTFVSHMVLHKRSNQQCMNKIEQMFITCKLLRLRKVFRKSKKIPTLKKKKKKLKRYHLRKKTNEIIRSINLKNYSKFLNSISCAKIVEMNRVIDNIMCRHPYAEPKVLDCLFFFFNFFGKVAASKWKTEGRALQWLAKGGSKNGGVPQNGEVPPNGERPRGTHKQTKLCPRVGSTNTGQFSPPPAMIKGNASLDGTTIRKNAIHESHTSHSSCTNHMAAETAKGNPNKRGRSSFYTFLVHFVCFIKMHIETYVLQSRGDWHHGGEEEEGQPPPNWPPSGLPSKGPFPPNNEQRSSAPLEEDSSVMEPNPHCRTTRKILTPTNSKLIFNSVRKIMKNIFYSVRKINQMGNPPLVLKHLSMLNIIRADIAQCKSEKRKESLKKRSGRLYSTGTSKKSIRIRDGRATIIAVKNRAGVTPHSSNFLSEKCPLEKGIFSEMEKKNCANGAGDGERTKEAVAREDSVEKKESNYTIGMAQNGMTPCALKEGETPQLRNFHTNAKGIFGPFFNLNKRETWKYDPLVNDQGDNQIAERSGRKKDTNERRALIKKSKKNYFKKLKNIPQMASFKRFTRRDKHRSSRPRRVSPPNGSINAPMEICQTDRQSRNSAANQRINEEAFFSTPNSQTEEVPSDVSTKGRKNKVSLLKFIFALNDSNAKKYSNNITLIINFFFLKKKNFLSKCKNQIVGSSLNVLINDSGCKRLLNFSAPHSDTSCYINSNIVSLQYDDTEAIKSLHSLTSSKSVPRCTTPGITPSIDARTNLSAIPQKGEPQNCFKNEKSSTGMNKQKNNMPIKNTPIKNVSVKNMCNDLNSSIILLWKSPQFGYVLLDAHNSLHISINDPSSQFSLNLFRQHDDVTVGGATYRKGNLFFAKKGKKKMSFKKIKSMFSRILEKKKSAPVEKRPNGAILERELSGAGGDTRERQNGDNLPYRTALLPSGKNNLTEGEGDAPGDVCSRGDNFAKEDGPKPEEYLISDDNEVYFGDEYYNCYEGETPSAFANEGSHPIGESAFGSGPLQRPPKSEKNGELATHQERATSVRAPKSEHAPNAEKSKNARSGARETNETNGANEPNEPNEPNGVSKPNERSACKKRNRKHPLQNKHSIVINKFSNIINEAQRILSVKEKIINKKIVEQIHASCISPSSLTESEKEKMREIKNNELNKIMEEELRKVNKNFQPRDTHSFGNTSYTDDEFNIILYLEKRKKKKDQKGAKKKKQVIPLRRKEKYFIPFQFNRSKILKLKLLTLIENSLCSYDVNIGEGTFIGAADQQRQREMIKGYVDPSPENITSGFLFPLEEVPSSGSHNLAEKSIFSFLNSNASQEKSNVDMAPLSGEPNGFPKNRLTLTNQVGGNNLCVLHDDMLNDPPIEIGIHTEKNEPSAPYTRSKILPNEINKKKEHLQNEQFHNYVDIAPFEPCHSSSSTLLADKYPPNKCSSLHLSNNSHNKTNTHTNRTCESSYEIVNSATLHEKNNSTKGSSSSESNGSVQKGPPSAAKGRSEWGQPPKEGLTHSSLLYKHSYNNLETHSKERGSAGYVRKLDRVDNASLTLEKREGDAPSNSVEHAKRGNYFAPHIVGHGNRSEDLHLELSPLEKCVKRNHLYNNVGKNGVAQHDEAHLAEKREHFLNSLLSRIRSERNGADHLGGNLDDNAADGNSAHCSFDRSFAPSAANPHGVLGAEKVGLLNLHCLFENKSANFCLISEGCAKASNYVNDSMLIHTKLYNEIFHIKKDDMSASEGCSMLGESVASNSSNASDASNASNPPRTHSDGRHSGSTGNQTTCIHKKKKILCNSCGSALKKNLLNDLFFFRITIINIKSFLSKRVKINIHYQSPLIRANFASKDNVRYSLEKNMTEYKLRIIAINKKKMRKKLSLSKSKFFRKCLEIELVSSLDDTLISQGEEKKEVGKCSRDGSSVHSSTGHFNTHTDDRLGDKIERRKNLSYRQIKNYSKRLSSMNQSSNDVPPAIYNSHFAVLNFSILDDKNKKKYDVERFIVPSTLFYTNG